MDARHFEDFTVGDRFTSPGITVTESSIIQFAQLYDPQPFHLDVTAAAGSAFGGLIASGFHTLAVTFRMFLDVGILAGTGRGSPGIDTVRWILPVRPGDTLHTNAEVVGTRASSKGERGFVTFSFEALNQRGEVVMTYTSSVIVARRT